MKILMQTTYYYPHISGLTLYFQHLAEELVKRGHEVTMITARHRKNLSPKEVINGVKVIRTPVYFRLNKGLFLPQIIFDAWPYLKKADIVHLNLPAVEALDIAVAAKSLRKPVVSTYVCDLTLPKFPFSKVLDRLVDLNHFLTLKLSDRMATYTRDFAQHSRVLKYFDRVVEIYPPVTVEEGLKSDPAMQRVATSNDSGEIRNPKLELLTQQSEHPVVGMATRWAADKGIEYLLEAIPYLTSRFTHLKIVFAGNTHAVGEEKYYRRLEPLLKKFSRCVIILGQLNPSEMVYFYRVIDLLVVASVNSTEAFGIVQVEAMQQGTPVVATNLPGVRVPVQKTGMGKVAKVADSKDLAEKIIQVLENREDYIQPLQKICDIFNPDESVRRYLRLYERTLST